MAYRIEGLQPDAFEPLFALPEEALDARLAVRVTADSPTGFPCRVSLRDAEPGESLILVNHVSNDVPTPFRTTHAIYVREAAREPAVFVDALPPVFDGRTLGLRAYDLRGMLRDGRLVIPGEAEAAIQTLFQRPEIAVIHAHTAAFGCFLARIERD